MKDTKQFKNGGAGQTIRCAVVECCLGWMAVAGTERGICLIEFMDDPQDLRDDLAVRFPGTELREDDPEFMQWAKQVVDFVAAPTRGLGLPLDIQGTVFQRKVWEQLQAVPPGTTSTYAEIARQIGKPKSARAVASACAANKLAVAIPCHRIVRKNGDLSGYRWGVERKRKLIEKEAASAPTGGR